MRTFDSSRTEGEIVQLTPDPDGVRNCYFESAKYVENERSYGGGYLQIVFKQKGSGASIPLLVSDIDPDYQYTSNKTKATKRDGTEDERGRTLFEKACDEQDAILKHVFKALTGIDYNERPVSGKTFKEYVEAYIATIDVEKAKKLPIHWLKLQYKKKSNGSVTVVFPQYPPFLSTEYSPRDWNKAVTNYDRENRVFQRPVEDMPEPDKELENRIPYEDSDEEVIDTDEVSSDDDDEVV